MNKGISVCSVSWVGGPGAGAKDLIYDVVLFSWGLSVEFALLVVLTPI